MNSGLGLAIIGMLSSGLAIGGVWGLLGYRGWRESARNIRRHNREARDEFYKETANYKKEGKDVTGRIYGVEPDSMDKYRARADGKPYNPYFRN